MTLADNPIQARYAAFFETDFMPLIRQEQTQGAPDRLAYASEYAAHQPGEINKKRGSPIDLIARPAKNGDAS
jgi:hypothetical protein